MADLQSIIKIIFSGDDQVSGIANNTAESISKLGDVANTIAEPFSSLTNKILLFDTALTAAAVVIGVKAVSASNEFGASLADLDRFLSDTEGSASQYKQTFDDLSVKYGTSVNDIVQSTSDWRAANYDIKTSLELTKTALDYSIAGQISAGDATDTLKKIVSGMSIANDDVVESSKRMGDIMNYIGDSAKTNFKQVSDGVAGIAPAINLSGASFEQATAIIAVMNEVLQSGSRSAASFNVIMGQLKSPTKDAEIALKDFSVQVSSNGITQDSFYGTLSKIAAKWPELTAAQKANYTAMLVGSEQTVAFTSIMDGFGKVGVLASESVTKGINSMSAEVTRSLGTSEAAFKSFNQSIELLFITLGTQISPGIVAVVKSLTDLDVTLKKTAESKDNPFAPLSDSLKVTLTEFSSIIDAVSKDLPEALKNVDFSGLIKSFDGLFGELGGLFKAFFGDIDLTTVEGLSSALQKIIDVGSLLVTTTQGIVAAFEQFAEAAGRAVDNFVALDKGSQLDFGKFIGSAKLLIDAGIGLGSALIAIGQAGIEMGRVIDIAFGTVKVGINALQVGFETIALAVVETAIKIAEATKGIFEFTGATDNAREVEVSIDSLRKTADSLTESIIRNSSEMSGGFQQIIGNSTEKVDSLSSSLKNSSENLDSLKNTSIGAALGVDDVKNSVVDTSTELEKLKDISIPKIEFASKTDAAEAAGQIKHIGEEANMLVPHLVNVRDENGNVIKSYTELTNVIPGVTGGLSILGSSMDKAKDKAKDATKESDNFRIKMEEIASNERIKTIDAYVKLNVADLEAQAKQVQAAFSSIDTTIKSTGDLLGGLFGNLSSADTYTKLRIIEQIEAENKRRDAALELQKQLTQAEIENIQAKSRALEKGDSVIKIDGTGLEPHLNAFMFEILKAIRVSVNPEFQQYLLGLNPA